MWNVIDWLTFCVVRACACACARAHTHSIFIIVIIPRPAVGGGTRGLLCVTKSTTKQTSEWTQTGGDRFMRCHGLHYTLLQVSAVLVYSATSTVGLFGRHCDASHVIKLLNLYFEFTRIITDVVWASGLFFFLIPNKTEETFVDSYAKRLRSRPLQVCSQTHIFLLLFPCAGLLVAAPCLKAQMERTFPPSQVQRTLICVKHLE